MKQEKAGYAQIIISRPKIIDGRTIQKIINQYANDGLLIPLSLHDVYERIRNFWVAKDSDEIIGVAALHTIWENLAEIRSLAVQSGYQRQGIGRALVNQAIEEAKQLEIQKIFILTLQREFFLKMGFHEVNKAELPHKVWSDCLKCIKFPECDEIAMAIDLYAG